MVEQGPDVSPVTFGVDMRCRTVGGIKEALDVVGNGMVLGSKEFECMGRLDTLSSRLWVHPTNVAKGKTV